MITSVVLPLALAIIMFTLGLGLKVEDFKRIFVYPRGVSIGMVNLVLISPLLAFGIADLFNLEPLLAMGLVLLGASPGGTLANMFTHLARGETALSITMTALSSVVAVITIPFFLNIANNYFGAGNSLDDVNMWSVVLRTFLITIVPLSLGLWLRTKAPERVERIRPPLTRASLVLFVLVVVGAVISEFDLIKGNLAGVAAAALALNLAAMSISYAASKLGRLSQRQATAIALELGIHNGTVAIVVAGMINDQLMIPAAVYSAFMFITGGIFAKFMHSRNAEAFDATAMAESTGPAPT
ncbi:MAG: bile acid:sodium symporter family protein [Solirubrobacterales bacterium]